VTILDKETNQSQTATSSGEGTYTFNRLAPAQYSVTAEASGFAKRTIDNVSISGETMQGLNITLGAEGGSQTVTVTDTSPEINTATANIAGTITSRELQALPSSNRDPYQLLRLAPGALGDASQTGGGGSYSLPGNGGIGGSSATGSVFQVENRAQTQANGVRTSGNSFQIDGSQVNSLAWGGGAVITPNQESVKEVQTQTSPYDATNGRNSGAQVLVVSKNGTNQFHGSAFFKFHRPGLNAYQRYNGPGSRSSTDNTKTLQRDNNRFNQLGGSIGVPSGRTTSSSSSPMKSFATAVGLRPLTGMRLRSTTSSSLPQSRMAYRPPSPATQVKASPTRASIPTPIAALSISAPPTAVRFPTREELRLTSVLPSELLSAQPTRVGSATLNQVSAADLTVLPISFASTH